MNLVIDLGNTSAKVGLFEHDKLRQYAKIDTNEIYNFVQTHQPEHILICSVNSDAKVLREQLISLTTSVYLLNHQLPVPLTNYYQTPHTLGADRVAAVVGAKTLHPDQNCLVIDLGTCITYDFIDAANNYWGGSISPGVYMRFRAMHTFTARLPLVEPSPDIPLTGRNTTEALQSGVIYGMAAELEGIIAQYLQERKTITTILCGGDALLFETKIKAPIFVIPELVLIGLNRILAYNVKRV
jgi:type III pantothenate kinase